LPFAFPGFPFLHTQKGAGGSQRDGDIFKTNMKKPPETNVFRRLF
jgi:hypothetical protein